MHDFVSGMGALKEPDCCVFLWRYHYFLLLASGCNTKQPYDVFANSLKIMTLLGKVLMGWTLSLQSKSNQLLLLVGSAACPLPHDK